MSAEFLEAAREEFLEAVSFYEREAAGLGADFIAEIERALDSLQAIPGLGAPFGAEVRRKLVRRFPFQILYLEVEGTLIVVAVAHLKRRPGYWRERLQ